MKEEKDYIYIEVTLVEDSEDKGYTAYVGDFIAEGDTREEALENLKYIILKV